MSGPDGKTQAERLLSLALAAATELWATPEGQPCITFPVAAHREHHLLRTGQVRDWLSRQYYEDEGRAPSSQALADALGVLRGKALYEGSRYELSVRYAAHRGATYLDLGDAKWRAVKIDRDGWRIVADPPVRFRRPRGLLALPEPGRDGDLGALRALLNVDYHGWRLICGWLVGTMAPTGPYPLLSLYGEAGSAKSTAARLLRELTDPNIAPLRSEPRGERDLAIAAGNGRILALDNVSRISTALSDALCRLATGGGFATRELYSDSEELLLHYCRPAIVTGITEVITRGDLADRASVVTLLPIADHQRRTEAELAARWAEVQPIALGGLLDATVTALRRLPEVELPRLPRLADHARWVAAAEPALGWESDAYLAAYGEARILANEAALEESPLTEPLRELAEEGFIGSATELLAALSKLLTGTASPRGSWPSGPRELSGALRRLAPSLRTVGIEVAFPRRGSRRRPIVVQKIDGDERQNRHTVTRGDRPDDADDGPNAAHTARSAPVPAASPAEEAGFERLADKFDLRGEPG